MKILALDIATNTGFAFGEPGTAPRCWSEKLGVMGDVHAARFAQMTLLIRAQLKRLQPDLVAVEQPIAAGAKGGADRILLAAGLRGIVMAEARLSGCRIGEWSVQTIRKHFIGSGGIRSSAAKAETIEECRRRGWLVDTHDQADAAALWDLACAKSGFQVSPRGLFSGLPPDA